MLLSTPISDLKGVGSVTQKNLKNLDIKNIQDLLFYFPFRYDDFSQTAKIKDLQVGQIANIQGQIELIQNKRSPKRRMYLTECLVNDGTDTLRVIWFNQPFLTRNLKVGQQVSLAGRITEDYGGLLMTSPQYEKLTTQTIHTAGIVPVYHLTLSLAQKTLRSLIAKTINLANQLVDWLPKEISNKYKLIALAPAIKEIHFPKNKLTLQLAKERLGFDELFLRQLQAQKQRQIFAQLIAPSINFHEEATKRLVANLPYDLTKSQKQSAWEIIKSLKATEPMLRLLQGDVGSGKTVVACLAMFNVALDNYQSALMVPTEILALQHFSTLGQIFAQENITIALLTSGYQQIIKHNKIDQEISKKELLKSLASGEIDIIIGTHSLIQKEVNFKNLGLVVVDEQHRFGVEQRKLLTQKVKSGGAPHLLSMTATPIPRSLALALYGNLDISLITEMPTGRKKVLTKVITEAKRQEVYNFIAQELQEGNQAFVVCPLIDESDKLGLKSVKTEYEKLNTKIFKDYKIGLLHGRLKANDREKVMKDFAEGRLDILVTTSIIEIGVDIPKATVMMIEGAERFGLAQLHQYRGRVGRRQNQGFCFLMSDTDEISINQRLEAMTKLNDGFSLANVDLKFRGPGEVYGLEQKGFPELKMANFYDTELIKKSREAALEILKSDPDLSHNKVLLTKLGEGDKTIHLE